MQQRKNQTLKKKTIYKTVVSDTGGRSSLEASQTQTNTIFLHILATHLLHTTARHLLGETTIKDI